MGADPVNNVDPDGGMTGTSSGPLVPLPAPTSANVPLMSSASSTSGSSSAASGSGSPSVGALNTLCNAAAGYLGRKLAEAIAPLPKGPDARNLQLTNNSDCRIIAETPFNSNGIRGGDDWNADPNGLAVSDMDNLSNEQLFEKMLMTLQLFSTGELDNVAKNIRDHFRGNTGSDFQDRNLEKSVLGSSTLTDWISKQRLNIQDKLQSAGGDISKLSNLDVDPPAFPMYDHSVSLTWSSGLYTIVGGTQYASFCLKHYEFDKSNKTYVAHYRLTILDDFGVSASDVQSGYDKQKMLEKLMRSIYPPPLTPKIPNVVEGIKAFWILQHRRGFVPFVNRLQFDVKLGGKLQ